MRQPFDQPARRAGGFAEGRSGVGPRVHGANGAFRELDERTGLDVDRQSDLLQRAEDRRGDLFNVQAGELRRQGSGQPLELLQFGVTAVVSGARR